MKVTITLEDQPDGNVNVTRQYKKTGVNDDKSFAYDLAQAPFRPIIKRSKWSA